MSKQLINIGSSPNDGTGDNLRNSFIKINNNFNEVYAFSGTTGGTSGTSGTSGLGGGGGVVTNVTYSGLTTLINNNQLIAGGLYLITDYQTVHVIPNANQNSYSDGTLQIGIQYRIPTLTSGDDFSNVGYVADGVPFFATNTTPNVWDYGTDVYDYLYTGPIEPLLVTASSTNTLKPESYSSLYSKDIIYYNYYNDQTMVPGCTKGYIYRRIDTLQNNDIPFDFRNVKFRRWQINITNTWNSGTTYNPYSNTDYNIINNGQYDIYVSLVSGNTNNNINDTNYWYKFYEIYNNQFISTSADSYRLGRYYNVVFPCNNNYIDYNMYSTTNLYNSSFNNIIEKQFFIPISSEINNDIISYSNNVIFGTGNFNNNKIGCHFTNNNINGEFNNNIIGNDFSDNFIGSNFNNNNISNMFQYNLAEYGFQYNNIDNIFQYNFIKSGFTYNLINNNFYNINFNISTYVYNSNIKTKELFINSLGQYKLMYDKITIVDANT